MLLSSNVALIGGNSTKPGSSYYAPIIIKAALSLTTVREFNPPHRRRRPAGASGQAGAGGGGSQRALFLNCLLISEIACIIYFKLSTPPDIYRIVPPVRILGQDGQPRADAPPQEEIVEWEGPVHRDQSGQRMVYLRCQTSLRWTRLTQG